MGTVQWTLQTLLVQVLKRSFYGILGHSLPSQSHTWLCMLSHTQKLQSAWRTRTIRWRVSHCAKCVRRARWMCCFCPVGTWSPVDRSVSLPRFWFLFSLSISLSLSPLSPFLLSLSSPFLLLLRFLRNVQCKLVDRLNILRSANLRDAAEQLKDDDDGRVGGQVGCCTWKRVSFSHGGGLLAIFLLMSVRL